MGEGRKLTRQSVCEGRGEYTPRGCIVTYLATENLKHQEIKNKEAIAFTRCTTIIYNTLGAGSRRFAECLEKPQSGERAASSRSCYTRLGASRPARRAFSEKRGGADLERNPDKAVKIGKE
ncbi:hypothetical protein EVAR_15674_1 [Eumeta japonica]|uniref:Uncharacterized protein n=1 Tax=Eumeta variegata TaxID=151549 RepID=A0A4C1UA64_EUMVA|nr:hypothetical protein EVAR_15674_1 [Eumeta japonica]